MFQFYRQEEEEGFPGSASGSITGWREVNGRGAQK
jgi:hypothetical protein